jgi:hypothetical protein
MTDEKWVPNDLLVVLQREILLRMKELDENLNSEFSRYKNLEGKIAEQWLIFNWGYREIFRVTLAEEALKVLNVEILLDKVRPVRLAEAVAKCLDAEVVARRILATEMRQNPLWNDDHPALQGEMKEEK